MPRKKKTRTATIDADDGDRRILPAEIGLGAFLDGGGDVLHCRLLQNLRGGYDAVQDCKQPARNGQFHDYHGLPVSPPMFDPPETTEFFG
jgi:hypothetical protein